MSALTARGDPDSSPSDLQLIAWVAFNRPELEIILDAGSARQLMTQAGEPLVVEGRIPSGELASLIADRGSSFPPDGVRTGRPALAPFDYMAAERGRDADPEDMHAFAGALARIFRALPAPGDWMSGTLRMIAPLPRPSDGCFASSSSPGQPGLIRLSVGGDLMQVLEGIVHESAHLYLFRFERGGRLVREGCATAFSSPLRSDPRPLRGVLLAMHACAYISAAFAEAGLAGLEDPRRCEAQKRETLELFEQARHVVDAATEFLTDRGRRFVAKTKRVAEYAQLQPA